MLYNIEYILKKNHVYTYFTNLFLAIIVPRATLKSTLPGIIVCGLKQKCTCKYMRYFGENEIKLMQAKILLMHDMLLIVCNF
jgi:hypothetical protein